MSTNCNHIEVIEYYKDYRQKIRMNNNKI